MKQISKAQGFCKDRKMKSHPARLCTGCDQLIADRFLFCVDDAYWHEKCLECFACRCPLTDSCYSKENKLFCRTDYRRLFGTKCSTCKQDIAANELVMRALQNVYHLHCFKCDECGRNFEKGDEFGLKDNRLYCKDDLHGIKREKGSISDSTVASDRSELSPAPSDISCDTKSPKRPRTILTSSQRKAFKASFEMTPKPCRKVREELSRDTGLSVRVVQVWFQNQRAKLKKIAKKSNPHHADDFSNKIGGKSKKKNKGKNKGDADITSKKRSCQQECNNIQDTPHSPSLETIPYSNQIQQQQQQQQPLDSMLSRPNAYPGIPPPNLQPFYSNQQQANSCQPSGNFSCLSPSDLPPPPYTMRIHDTMVLDNRMQGLFNFGHGMNTSFLEQIERARPTNQLHLMNHTLNSF